MKENVTSLKLSKALLPAMRGVKSAFYWTRHRINKYNKWGEWYLSYNPIGIFNDQTWQMLPTYTLPELLSVLPSNIETKDCEHGESHNCAWHGRCRFAGGLKIEKDGQDYIAGYECREHTYIAYESGDLTEAAAQLVLWCAEQGHMEGEL